MPLNKSPTKAAFSENVSTLMHEGRPQKQALAIAYATKRRGRAEGGELPIRPRSPSIVPKAPKDVPRLSISLTPSIDPRWGNRIPFGPQPPYGEKLERHGGRINRAAGGLLKPPDAPWYIKSQARAMPVKSGPILSTVPGRSDRHNMNVGSGSYVVPADAVSHLGENNTLAGTKILNYMFGSGGPYGSKTLPLKQGARFPRGRRFALGGDTGGEPTPIAAAGGEYIIPPEKIIEMYGSLDRGHAILDHWVLSNRKKHIKTLRGLKPPAKD